MQKNELENKPEEINKFSVKEIQELEKSVKFYSDKDGSHQAYYQFGDPHGHPVFFFHGTGSHVQGMLLHKPAMKFGFRIISPDRPGVSRSCFRSGWTVLEYANDIAKLADYLGIERFGAIGISGGGPTLMASAYAIPERICWIVDLACTMPIYGDSSITCHLGKKDRFSAWLATRLPRQVFNIPFSIIGKLQKMSICRLVYANLFSYAMGSTDKEILADASYRLLFITDAMERFRWGSKGPAYDALTAYQPWGFDLSAIKVHIDVFHGTDDNHVPPICSKYLALKAKNVSLNLVEGIGHFYFLANGFGLLRKIKEYYYNTHSLNSLQQSSSGTTS